MLDRGRIATNVAALMGASSGPTVASLLEELNAFDATVSSYNVTDTSTASMSSARLSVVAVTPGGAVGQLFDQKGSHDLVAPSSDAMRPLNTNGLTWDGGDDRMNAVSPGTLPATLTLMALCKTTDTFAVCFGDSSDSVPYAVRWHPSDAATPISTDGTVWLDAAEFTSTAVALSAAVADGDIHAIEARGFLTASLGLNFSWGRGIGTGGAGILGIFLPICILDEAQADYADALAAAVIYRDAIIAELALGN